DQRQLHARLSRRRRPRSRPPRPRRPRQRRPAAGRVDAPQGDVRTRLRTQQPAGVDTHPPPRRPEPARPTPARPGGPMTRPAARPQPTPRATALPGDASALRAVRITEHDLYGFTEGTHFPLYDKLGAHPARREGETGVAFAVWAPSARRVSVVGDFNG